jgi:hypothetical protein
MAMGTSMTQNHLLQPAWADLDQIDLRILLKERIGGHGQLDSERDVGRDVFYLPQARDQCRVALRFKGTKIVAIEPGAAFDSGQWDSICNEIETSVLIGQQQVGRDLSFSAHRVEGSWRGERSGVQILPPPSDAPLANEGGDNPFILEFPIQEAGLWPITNHRRIREHRRLTLVLNLLLAGNIRFLPDRRRQFWANVNYGGAPDIKWVNEWYFADIGQIIIDELSPPASKALEVLKADKYYNEVRGLDGLGLRVPDDLDDLIYRYQRLPRPEREKFDRATYWMSMARRQWEDSMSASFTSLVSAVEALTAMGIKHHVYCSDCGKCCSHDVPGSTERFRAFFETYAPDPGLKKRRSEMYAMRSKILHGSDLMQLDQDRPFGWDPPGWNEYELNSELWSLTRIAARNWLRAQIIIMDRVSPLDSKGIVLEVHGVGIRDDALVYARGLAQRDRNESRPARPYLIERRGQRLIYSAEQLARASEPAQ